jgi:hypothetical protein
VAGYYSPRRCFVVSLRRRPLDETFVDARRRFRRTPIARSTRLEIVRSPLSTAFVEPRFGWAANFST